MNRTVLIMAVGAFVGAVLASAFRGKLRSLVERVGRRRCTLAVLLWVVTSLFYSVVHEFGHYAAGELLGGDVRPVAWTIFSGENPHVRYVYLPEGVRPWTNTAGVVCPVVLGLLLGGVWVAAGHRWPWPLADSLLMPTVVLLLIGTGGVVEIFTGGYHMTSLARHYDLGAAGRILMPLVPAAISAAGLAGILWRVRRQRLLAMGVREATGHPRVV